MDRQKSLQAAGTRREQMDDPMTGGTARAKRHGSEGCVTRRQQLEDDAPVGASSSLYSSRSGLKSDGDITPAVALRPLTEGLLKLEHQLKVWRRQMCRRLDNIDGRLRLCESALSLTKHAAPQGSTKGSAAAAAAAASICDGNSTVAGGSQESRSPNRTDEVGSELRNVQLTLATFSRMVAEHCHEKMVPANTSASIEGDISHACSEAKGVLTADNTPAATEHSGDNSHGLTPDDVEDPTAVHTSVHPGEMAHARRQATSSSPPPPPTPSFVTMTPVSARPSIIFESTRCCGSALASLPLVEEPRKSAMIAPHGARAAVVEPPPELPALRPASRKAISPTPVMTPSCHGLPPSPLVRSPLLQRQLFNSPDGLEAVQEHAFSKVKVKDIDFHQLRSLDDQLVRSSRPVGDGLGALQMPGKLRLARDSPEANVPSAFPIYMVPQHTYGSDSSSDSTLCPETDGEDRSTSSGVVVSAPTTLAVGSVWHKAVLLAHAEQQLEQLQRSLQPAMLTVISSGILDVSASTM